jgi:hypothetical protein
MRGGVAMTATLVRKPLPPFGAAVRNMIARHERPVLFGGAFIVALEWTLGARWYVAGLVLESPRIVIPKTEDPAAFELSYLRGCDVLVLHRPSHPRAHVVATVEALRAARANCVHPVALPTYDS